MERCAVRRIEAANCDGETILPSSSVCYSGRMHISNEHGRGRRAVPEGKGAGNYSVHGVAQEQFVQISRVHAKIRRKGQLLDAKISSLMIVCFI